MRKPYVRKMPADWWLKRKAYLFFMLREATAVFVGLYALLLLVMLWKLRQGPESYAGFVTFLKTPVSMAFHAVALVAAAFNSITTWNALPQVIPVRRGEDKIPPAMLIGPHYVAWLTATVVIVWILTGR